MPLSCVATPPPSEFLADITNWEGHFFYLAAPKRACACVCKRKTVDRNCQWEKEKTYFEQVTFPNPSLLACKRCLPVDFHVNSVSGLGFWFGSSRNCCYLWSALHPRGGQWKPHCRLSTRKLLPKGPQCRNIWHFLSSGRFRSSENTQGQAFSPLSYSLTE